MDGRRAVWSLAVVGERVITGGQDCIIRVYDLNGVHVRSLVRHKGAVLALCCAGGYLFSSSADSEIMRYAFGVYMCVCLCVFVCFF